MFAFCLLVYCADEALDVRDRERFEDCFFAAVTGADKFVDEVVPTGLRSAHSALNASMLSFEKKRLFSATTAAKTFALSMMSASSSSSGVFLLTSQMTPITDSPEIANPLTA